MILSIPFVEKHRPIHSRCAPPQNYPAMRWSLTAPPPRVSVPTWNYPAMLVTAITTAYRTRHLGGPGADLSASHTFRAYAIQGRSHTFMLWCGETWETSPIQTHRRGQCINPHCFAFQGLYHLSLITHSSSRLFRSCSKGSWDFSLIELFHLTSWANLPLFNSR